MTLLVAGLRCCGLGHPGFLPISALETHPCSQAHPRASLSPGRVPGAAWRQQSQRAASLPLSAVSCFVVPSSWSTAQHAGAISGHGWVALPAPHKQPPRKVPPQCWDVSVGNLSPTLPRGMGLPLSTLCTSLGHPDWGSHSITLLWDPAWVPRLGTLLDTSLGYPPWPPCLVILLGHLPWGHCLGTLSADPSWGPC